MLLSIFILDQILKHANVVLTSSFRGAMIHAEGVLKLLITITELAMVLRGEFFYKMLPN